MIMLSFDVVCVGSAKIDIFLSLHEANKHLRLIPETNELCLKYGEKITVDKADILLGGNAANVAVGLTRLGLQASILAETGDDEFSQKITKALTNENVDLSYLKKTAGQPSSFSTIINFKGERTILSEHVKRKHEFDFNNISTKWVYLTSLGEEWKDAYRKTHEFVKRSKSRLAFNPGTIQLNEGYQNIKDALSITDILFVNKEEATEVLSIKYEVLSMDDILKTLQKMGPKVVVITDGKNGSYSIDEKGQILREGIIDAKVIEKTGAGDAYSSGFLGGVMQGKSIKEAMHWGTRNSTSVIGQIGAQPGLLRKSEMEKN